MPRKRKGELPSGNIRRQVYVGNVPDLDINGKQIYDKNGKPKMKRKYVSITASTPQEADLLAMQAKQEYETPTVNDMTIREAINKYIEIMQPTLSQTTIDGYEKIRDYAFPTIMDLKIKSLDSDMLQHAINLECKRPSKSPRAKGEPISPKTVCNEWGLIATILKKYAPNKTYNVNLPKHVATVHEISSPEVLFKAFKGTNMELPVLLAMWLSFTMSEIRGLTKSGSIKGDYIYIDQVTVNTKQGIVTKKVAKNTARNRMHRIPPYIKELIDKVDGDVLVPMTYAMLQHNFVRTLERNNLPHMTFHDLRHVNASVMNFLNIPDKYAMERGGWTSDKIMKNTYTQTYNTERIKVDNVIDDYFSSIISEKKKDAKYEAFLILFDKKDSSKSYQEYMIFRNMQHDLQHEIEKAL